MSRVTCPSCSDRDHIYLFESIDRYTDVHTGKSNEAVVACMECRRCGWTWDTPQAVSGARRRIAARNGGAA